MTRQTLTFMRAAMVGVGVLTLLGACGGAPGSGRSPVTPGESARSEPSDGPRDVDGWLERARGHHEAASDPTLPADAVLRHADDGAHAALQALDLIAPELAQQLRDGTFAEPSPPPETLPGLYWYAEHLWTGASQRGYADLLLAAPLVIAVMQTCERMQPDYAHHGALGFRARELARPLDLARRDLDASRSAFEQLITLEPNHLPHRVAMARHYAVAAQDRVAFEQQLRQVIESAASASSDDPTQAMARQQARMMLDQVSELFE